MTLVYRLNYSGEVYTIKAGGFEEALKKLNEQLKIDIKENQVRISSVVRIDEP